MFEKDPRKSDILRKNAVQTQESCHTLKFVIFTIIHLRKLVDIVFIALIKSKSNNYYQVITFCLDVNCHLN